MEYLAVLDDTGRPTGVRKTKKEVHANGDWHTGVHVWILNPRNELLLQRRSLSKRSWPGAWDVSVGGHVAAGEEPVAAARREIHEEIGLDILPGDLRYLFTSKDKISYAAHHENAFHHIYLVRSAAEIKDMRMLATEVEDLKFLPLVEMEAMVRARNPATIVPHWAEYSRTIELIKNAA